MSISPPLPQFSSANSSSSSTTKSKPHEAVSLLQIARTHSELCQLHSLLVKTALIREKHACGRLLHTLASLCRFDADDDAGVLRHAQKLFDSPGCPKNSFTFNAMIRSYSRAGDRDSAFLIFRRMLLYGSASPPDGFTYTFVLNACARSLLVFEGRQVHAQMVKKPSCVSTQSWNSLMDFYVKAGEDVWRVHKILCKIREPDIVSWNSLLDGFVKSGDLESAQKLFDEMPQRDVISWTTLLVGYANAGMLKEACCLFDEMPERSMVSWSAMIGCYARLGLFQDALALFTEMQALKISIDKITLTVLLSACAGLGALDQGRWIHAYIDRHGIWVDAHLSTALVDMYGKCGKIDMAYKVFRSCKDKKVFLWNSMLGALSMHSRGSEAGDLFTEMINTGIMPNAITFICILSAYSHSGLVNDGLRIFCSMAKDYKIKPTVEHFGCVVDLLGRAGLLDEALKIIDLMPMAADGNVWRALLGACMVYGNVELGEHVGKILLDLEPFDDGNYILLSNLYANKTKWEHVSNLRRVMKEKGVKKTPGCSSIEVNEVVYLFVAGHQSHPQSMEIYNLVEELTLQISTMFK